MSQYGKGILHSFTIHLDVFLTEVSKEEDTQAGADRFLSTLQAFVFVCMYSQYLDQVYKSVWSSHPNASRSPYRITTNMITILFTYCITLITHTSVNLRKVGYSCLLSIFTNTKLQVEETLLYTILDHAFAESEEFVLTSSITASV